MKKIFISTIVALLLMMVVASTTFAARTVSEHQLLLKGSWQAVETSQVVFPTIFVTGTGSGNATQLGLYTVSYQYQVNAPTGFGSGFIQFVAANGDTIFAAGTGQSSPTGTPNVITIVEQHTITGGTGRFDGASGTIMVERVLDRATGVSSGSINGSITLP
jgi:hypothetical protein